MSLSQHTQPQQLFGASMHAGGWPKLGWAHQEALEDAPDFDEELLDFQQDN